MKDLDNGIKNMKVKLKRDSLSDAERETLSFVLRSMMLEKEQRERSPQPFYKDHG